MGDSTGDEQPAARAPQRQPPVESGRSAGGGGALPTGPGPPAQHDRAAGRPRQAGPGAAAGGILQHGATTAQRPCSSGQPGRAKNNLNLY